MHVLFAPSVTLPLSPLSLLFLSGGENLQEQEEEAEEETEAAGGAAREADAGD